MDTSEHSALGRMVERPRSGLRAVGVQVDFYVKAYAGIPIVLRRYLGEVLRQLTSISFGTGALVLIGGSVVVVAILTASAGAVVGLQGYEALNAVGTDALTGFLASYINIRLAAPLIGGVALVSTIGAAFTAEIGAQRISEEIDAIEVMAVPSVPFLVTTRILAGTIAIIPLYALALIACFATTQLIVVLGYGQSVGTYNHYFATFLIPTDVLTSMLQVTLIAFVVMSIHAFYGFTASGGPAGVGAAVGRAVRLSLIAVMVTALVTAVLLYADPETLHLSR
ncbi:MULTISPECIES: ABC transporter permease [unclassified Pseudonocardia]|uniref:ABC transporter permease n=1 Tax=unclassified Pseudonocardia TaxID=2619320 RepID=UPI0002F99AC6|nr:MULTISPECIES: ABC transporter permease [unclassified Pseudonocardia]